MQNSVYFIYTYWNCEHAMRERFNAVNESYNLIFVQEGGLGNNMIYLSLYQTTGDIYLVYILPVL